MIRVPVRPGEESAEAIDLLKSHVAFCGECKRATWSGICGEARKLALAAYTLREHEVSR